MSFALTQSFLEINPPLHFIAERAINLFQVLRALGDPVLELEIQSCCKLFNLLAIRYIDDRADETNGFSRCIEERLSLRRYPVQGVVTRMNDSVFDVVETVVYAG